MVFHCEKLWKQIVKIEKDHHVPNTTATQIECNSSYFKLSIFEKAEVGCQNLQIESLELYFAKTSNFKFTGKID